MDTPSEPDRELPDDAQRRRNAQELHDAAQHRRDKADAFAWGVPGLAVAAEAFLLTIALNPDTRPLGRLAAALAGTLVLVGALHFLSKQSMYFGLYDGIVERQREELKLQSLHREKLDQLSVPDHVRRPHRSWFSWDLKSVVLWKLILGGLILIDVAIFVYAIFEWTNDPGWLSRAS